MSSYKPNLPVPEPLRAQVPGTWAHSTVTVRLPEITRRVIIENALQPDAVVHLERLIGELPRGAIRPLHEPSAPDWEAWKEYVAPYLGQSWLAVPWFFAETYFYRRILEATGYFQPGPGFRMDPFAYQKKQGLSTSSSRIGTLSNRVAAILADTRPTHEGIQALFYADLWGNRADLSLWPADHPEAGDGRVLEQSAHAILADDSVTAAAYITEHQKPVRVDIICDNAGYEFMADLFLGYYLIQADIVQELVLHVKNHPTFVSDATREDVRVTLDSLAIAEDAVLQQQVQDLLSALKIGKLKVSAPSFWTSPLSGWEMPSALRADLSQASLIIVKGDANYRRLLGDRHWPFTTPFADILSYSPAPLLALRTLKAEVASGLKPERIKQLEKMDPTWMTNGEWGVVQFVIP